MEDKKPHSLAIVARGSPLALDRNPYAVFLGRLAPGSRRAMAHGLEMVARLLSGGSQTASTLDWSQVRYQHVAAVREALAGRFKPATVNRSLSGIRGTLQEAWRLGLITGDDYQRAVDVQNVKATVLLRGRALSAGELRTLFDTCSDGSVIGARDAALLAILYGGGLRRAEAVGLDLIDYDGATGALTVRHGKGRKQRIAYLPSGGVASVEGWVLVRGAEAGPLLCPVLKGSRIVLRRMSAQAVLNIIRARAEQAGVSACSPHDMRRSCVSDLLEAGADIATVAKLVGHANVQTTARYDRRGEATKKKAADLLYVPYRDGGK